MKNPSVFQKVLIGVGAAFSHFEAGTTHPPRSSSDVRAAATNDVVPDRTPFKLQIKDLLDELRMKNQILPQEGKNKGDAQESEQEHVPRKIRYESEFTEEDFDATPNAHVDELEKPSEESSTMQLFRLKNGQLKAEMHNHLHEDGWMSQRFDLFKDFPAIEKDPEQLQKFIHESGSGAFILGTEHGNIIFSTQDGIDQSSEEALTTGFIPGLQVAAIQGDVVDRCPGDTIPLRPLDLTHLSNEEVVANGTILTLEGMGSKLRRISGKAFPMKVTGKNADGEVLQSNTVLMLKVDTKELESPADLIGFHGAPALIENSGECAGMCTMVWRNANKDGTFTWMLFIVGPDELRSLQAFIDSNRKPEEEHAPDYDPQHGGETDF